MPGDDVVILGNPALKLLVIDIYGSLGTRAPKRAVFTGVDTVAYRQCRGVTVSVDALQKQTNLTAEEPDDAVECLVARGSDIDMRPEEELRARSEALEGAIEARATGLRDSHVERLPQVIGRCWNAFRHGLPRGDPPARVGPLRVTLKPGTRPVKARPRVYNLIKTAWLASYAALGLVLLNMQPVWASVAMATPKKGGFRMVSDFQVANQQVKKVLGVMLNQEASMA